MRRICLTLLFTCAAICLGSAAYADGGWNKVKTDKGCVFYVHSPFGRQASIENDKHWVWSEACTKGQPISDTGTLTYTGDVAQATNKKVETGVTFVGGYRNGVSTLTSYGSGAPFVMQMKYNMGCYVEADGSIRDCTPGSVASAAASSDDADIVYTDDRRFCARQMNAAIRSYRAQKPKDTRDQAIAYADKIFRQFMSHDEEGSLRSIIEQARATPKSSSLLQHWQLSECAAALRLGRMVGIRQAKERAEGKSVAIETLVPVIVPGSEKSETPN